MVSTSTITQPLREGPENGMSAYRSWRPSAIARRSPSTAAGCRAEGSNGRLGAMPMRASRPRTPASAAGGGRGGGAAGGGGGAEGGGVGGEAGAGQQAGDAGVGRRGRAGAEAGGEHPVEVEWIAVLVAPVEGGR